MITCVRAMYEAPSFVTLTPGGPPTPIVGSTTAKKVAQGGKLGIVQDPFGKLGSPTYLGATLPLDGYGIVNLSLSDDGKVLLGQPMPWKSPCSTPTPAPSSMAAAEETPAQPPAPWAGPTAMPSSTCNAVQVWAQVQAWWQAPPSCKAAWPAAWRCLCDSKRKAVILANPQKISRLSSGW